MAVSALPIVEHLDVIEHIGPGQLADFVDAFLDPLLLNAAEEGFPTALSRHLPRRLMLGSSL